MSQWMYPTVITITQHHWGVGGTTSFFTTITYLPCPTTFHLFRRRFANFESLIGSTSRITNGLHDIHITVLHVEDQKNVLSTLYQGGEIKSVYVSYVKCQNRLHINIYYNMYKILNVILEILDLINLMYKNMVIPEIRFYQKTYLNHKIVSYNIIINEYYFFVSD